MTLNLYMMSMQDAPLPPPLISGTTAINFLQELEHYFQSRLVATLPPVPGSGETNISDHLPVQSGPSVNM